MQHSQADSLRYAVKIYPMGIALRMRRGTKHGHHPAATLASTLKKIAKANGLITKDSNGEMPPRLFLDPIEIGRLRLEEGSLYNFGIALWGEDFSEVETRWNQIVDGLRRRGLNDESPRTHYDTSQLACEETESHGLRSFEVAHVWSLVEVEKSSLLAVSPEWIDHQIRNLLQARHCQLQWVTPLQATLPRRLAKSDRTKHPGFFDKNIFPLGDLLKRLCDRVRAQFHVDVPDDAEIEFSGRCLEPPGTTRLQWLSWRYGIQRTNASRSENESGDRDPQGKMLFGCIGKLQFRVRDQHMARALVLGQFCGLGEKLNFGMGRYFVCPVPRDARSIEAPMRIRPALGMIGLARNAECLPLLARQRKIELKAVEHAFKAILDGTYSPTPISRFLLPGKSDSRLITIPGHLDQVLQKATVEVLGPVVDRFLSNSCIAYRKGLGRTNAIDRFQHAVKLGYRWGLRTDFHRFFDSIDHSILRDKLEAFVSDVPMVNLLMQWVESSSPQPGRGLATGSPLSPLLSNLFLESFDREIQQQGGYLTRYGDDLAILYRTRDESAAALQNAERTAATLKLHLNESKTTTINLENSDFKFLGYRFYLDRHWQFEGNRIAVVDELGWSVVPKSGKPFSLPSLSGEVGTESSFRSHYVLGPDIDGIGVEGKELCCRSFSCDVKLRVPLRKLRTLIVLGNPNLDRSLLAYGAQNPLDVIFGNSNGRWTIGFFGETPMEDPGLITAQVKLLTDTEHRLHLSREIVSAKLNNYAALARAYPGKNGDSSLATQLKDLSSQATHATEFDQLRGYEGVGARLWYEQFESRIGNKFEFGKRDYPMAQDPVNILLNIAHSLMHRLFMLLLIRNGFASTIGIYHVASSGHASLASDLQEIYRHLMDRVVIDATQSITPDAFTKVENGDFSWRLELSAYRAVVASIFKTLSIQTRLTGSSEPRSYLGSMRSDVHNLRRHLVNRSNRFRPFRHY